MKKANLLHNPTAGEKDFSKDELVAHIIEGGFDCSYNSVKKKGWDDFSVDTDFLVIAGGDGTVRRVTKELLSRPKLDKHYPIALLPHGTANNIGSTLNIQGSVKDIISSWHDSVIKKFDIGKVYGLEKDLFFLEGFGCGIFPRLMKFMGKIEDPPGSTVEDRVKLARAALYQIVLDYKAQNCRVVADGREFSGKYILVEAMNTRSIGPKLEMALTADPGDGELDLVLVPEADQRRFAEYILNRIEGKTDDFDFKVIKAKNIDLEWEGKDVHLDDERIKVEKSLNVRIEIEPGMLEFMVSETRI